MPEIIERIPIGEELGEKFGLYAKYIIQDRALPDIRDGLKPVQRRILYGMYLEGNTYDKPYRKSAKSVGSIMGNLHPHGDSSTYGALVRLSQEWVMNHPLVDLHGNNGSIDGDGAAAMRYTEARLSKLATDCMLNGVKKEGIVDMIDNFDNTLKEPSVLPTQFPNLLINGSTGISAGYSTDIPTHNLAETLKGCIALIENPDLTVSELIQLIPAPDFPTGAVITGAKNMQSVYERGKGKVTVRATYTIEEKNSKKSKINFISIPYGIKKSAIVEKIDTIIADKKVAGLLDVRDESDRNGLCIAVECTKGTENTVLSYLFKHTDLQTDININMIVIQDRKPKLVNLKQVLMAFNDFRRETKTKEFTYEKNRLEQRLHLVKGFLKLRDIIKEVVPVIQEAEGKQDAKQKLTTLFEFTEQQSEAIVSMPLYKISKQDRKAFEEEEQNLTKAIKQLHGLLTSKKKMDAYLIKSYEGLIKEFGKPRQTQVIQEEESWEVNQMDIIADETVYVSVSKEGFVKRSSPRSYGATASCGVQEGDTIVLEQETSTKSFLCVVTNQARYTVVPVHVVEDYRWGDNGKHIGTLTQLQEGERILSAFVFDVESDKEKEVITVKTNGQVRRTSILEGKPHRSLWTLTPFIKLSDDEELHNVHVVEKDAVIGFTDQKDRKMYFPIEEIPQTGIRTSGVRGIYLKEGEVFKDYVVGTKEEVEEQGYPYRARGSRGQKV